jgi:hypothetical protein
MVPIASLIILRQLVAEEELDQIILLVRMVDLVGARRLTAQLAQVYQVRDTLAVLVFLRIIIEVAVVAALHLLALLGQGVMVARGQSVQSLEQALHTLLEE